MATDSGMPSITAPSTIAFDESGPSCSPPERLRWLPPRWSMYQSPAKKATAPAAKPPATASIPPRVYASSVRPKARALMSTPAPKAITSPITRWLRLVFSPTTPPSTRANPPTRPQNAASSLRHPSSQTRTSR